jgi:hypothetical protein
MLSIHGGSGVEHLENYPAGTTFSLARLTPLVSDTTDFAWPGIGDTISYQAYNDLVVTDQLITGTGMAGAVANYSARFNVHVIGEFHAAHGSETHLFNAQILPACGAEDRRSLMVADPPSLTESRSASKKESVSLLLQFVPAGSKLSLYPSPANDHIIVTGHLPDNDLSVVDEHGQVCFRVRTSSGPVRIDVAHLSPGQYVVHQVSPKANRSAPFQIMR